MNTLWSTRGNCGKEICERPGARYTLGEDSFGGCAFDASLANRASATILSYSGAFVNEESLEALSGQFEYSFGDPKLNLPVNKRDLSTRENGEKVPDSALQEAFNVARTVFSVEAGEPPELRRTFGMLGILWVS